MSGFYTANPRDKKGERHLFWLAPAVDWPYRMRNFCGFIMVVSTAFACAGHPHQAAPSQMGGASLWPGENALGDLRQLTFGGENAEAYWSPTGTELSLQARPLGAGCDRIARMQVLPAPGPLGWVSSGKGATTCAHFFPSGDLLFASTHLGGPQCPARPDMSQGYVWGLHGDYDIFATTGGRNDESALRRLTATPGYDAEGTVCAKDGSILFTSVRDGDLELYRMNSDGTNVRRLTHAPGYDGGAFFNADCSRIVWRASRPRPGKELDDYRALLGKALVRPDKLELWVANGDGSQPMQITYLDAASFAPFFHPTEDVILFATNHGQTSRREFDIWAVRPNGTSLRRITHAPGFDGFPHVSPDGKWLAFSSNRATAPGASDTNVFVARWKGFDNRAAAPDSAASRILGDINSLADADLQGRGVLTDGLAKAGAMIENRVRTLGLAPAGDNETFRQSFPVTTAIESGPRTSLRIGQRTLAQAMFTPLSFSGKGGARGTLAFAGYGLVDSDRGLDDYAGLDVKGKVVLVRRFAPETEALKDPAFRRRLGDIRLKAFNARERGAVALLVLDAPTPPVPIPTEYRAPPEAPLPSLDPESPGDAGIPVMGITRAAVPDLASALAAATASIPATVSIPNTTVELNVDLHLRTSTTFNVVGRIPAGHPGGGGPLIVGAHYDHLGLGGRHSLAPDRREFHPGADDNASGTATVLELAKQLYARRADLHRDVWIVLFSAEETGLLGSVHFTRTQPSVVKNALAMINLDMVGRLRGNRVEVLGTDSATEWQTLVSAACASARVDCSMGGDGHGPSDQASFFAAGVPVVHFFTGAHDDYHKPSDLPSRINAAGAAALVDVITGLSIALTAGPNLSFQKGSASPRQVGDARSFNASLGTIPEYAGPPGGQPGVLLAGVRAGGAAEQAGLRRGDILVGLGPHQIRSVEDLMFVLNLARPGDTGQAILIRDGKKITATVTYQESRR